MYFQLVIKGVSLPDDDVADRVLMEEGLHCNWWRKVREITEAQVRERLTPRNLQWHLSHYDDPDPDEGGEIFHEHTPYISTTAGTVARIANAFNFVHDPFITALGFATDTFRETGYMFYGYVYTLGKQSIPLKAFSEEVRELNIFQDYLENYAEGEITAKISIPASCLERYERYDGPHAIANWDKEKPRPQLTRTNPNYADPLKFVNLRGLVQ